MYKGFGNNRTFRRPHGKAEVSRMRIVPECIQRHYMGGSRGRGTAAAMGAL